MTPARPGSVARSRGSAPFRRLRGAALLFAVLAAPLGRLRGAALLLGALALTTAACGESGGGGGASDGRLDVVATTTQLADLARNVAGGRADVVRLLAPNTDPHEYEVRPDDVKALANASLVLRSGGDIDAWLAGAIKSSGTDAPVVTLIDHVRSRRAGSELDPHWWQDPRNAERAVAAIRDALSRADPGGAARYRAAAQRYSARLERLDASVAACWRRVPRAERKLVTTHDALGYYARRYGIQVIGTVIPSLSTQGQPSAGDTAKLVATIRRTGVKAIFAESSVNPKVEAAIARDTGAKVGRALWADTLGPAGSDGATYVQSIVSNTRALVDGLTGGAVRCTPR
jgi:ABC-type Zn uptake system ZnuABC Zn-binding protein ZnuA